jgi:hypothetical protein
MSNNVESLINQCIEMVADEDNDEFALFYFGDNWRAEIVNEAPVCCLGESPPKYSGHGDTMLEALENLREVLDARD